MIDAATIGQAFNASMDRSEIEHYPYDYWVLRNPLPDGAGESVIALPIDAADIDDTAGKRETNNATRVHFSPAIQGRYPLVRSIAEAFQDPAVVSKLEQTCGVDLRGSFLRIEYCQDKTGFWLQPHTDIGAKLFTMMIFLCEGEGAENWGTDVLDAEHRLVARAPCGFNVGMIFIPGENTWHSFQERPIQ